LVVLKAWIRKPGRHIAGLGNMLDELRPLGDIFISDKAEGAHLTGAVAGRTVSMYNRGNMLVEIDVLLRHEPATLKQQEQSKYK